MAARKLFHPVWWVSTQACSGVFFRTRSTRSKTGFFHHWTRIRKIGSDASQQVEITQR